MQRVSDDEIWAKRTEKAKKAGVGAWSRKQLAEWGVPCPPPKGWRRKLNGGVYCNAIEKDKVVTRARARLDQLPDFDDVVIDTLKQMQLDLESQDNPPWEV